MVGFNYRDVEISGLIRGEFVFMLRNHIRFVIRRSESPIYPGTSVRLDDRGSIPGKGKEGIFPSPQRLDQLWDPPSLLSNAYEGL
jgi:hypothetical protein